MIVKQGGQSWNRRAFKLRNLVDRVWNVGNGDDYFAETWQQYDKMVEEMMIGMVVCALCNGWFGMWQAPPQPLPLDPHLIQLTC